MMFKHILSVSFFMVIPGLFWGSVFGHVVNFGLGQAVCTVFLVSGLFTAVGIEL